MKVLISCYGTLGDVQPYVALAIGLKSKGHEVTIATSSRFESFIKGENLNFIPLDDELLKIIETSDGKELLEKTNSFFQVIKQGIKLKKKVDPLNAALMKENWQAAKKFSPDLILYHPKAISAPHIAERLGIKAILATPIPFFFPTTSFSLINIPLIDRLPFFNQLSFYFIKKITEVSIKKYVDQFRMEIGLPKWNNLDLIKNNKGQSVNCLHLFSETFLPKPTDWPQNAFVSGYCFLEQNHNWKPSNELQTFLSSGPPPIYVGFGSMMTNNTKGLTDIVIEAIEKSGSRAILATGWGGLQTGHISKNILNIDQAPHSWLFPRVSAVIHHGGAGTTAAGLRAGKPSLVIPFFGDQPFWGRQVYKKGLGPQPIKANKLNVRKLTVAIAELTTNTEMALKAKAIGEQMKQEDGIKNAISIIEELC